MSLFEKTAQDKRKQ